MLFKKKTIQDEIELEEKPLNYWEKSSYVIIPTREFELSKNTLLTRLSKIDNLKVLGIAEPSDDKPGRIVFSYLNGNYEFNYYIEEFKIPEFFDYQRREFSKEELDKIGNCTSSIVLFTEFTDNFKMEYKVQLLVSYYIVDELFGIIDESAEKLLHPKYVKMVVSSKHLPSTDALFTIQAVVDGDKVWLHTHGLCRCGFSEIEILNSNSKDYNEHYHLISTLANHIIDKGIREDNVYFIGLLNEETPIVVTLLPWIEGLRNYEGIDLGGPLDRKLEHNSNTSVIFVFEKEEDVSNKLVSKLEIYDGMWDNNPVFFITNEETERMKSVARERIKYMLDSFKNKENTILIKIGIKTDNSEDFEHMWFELLDILDNFELKVKLISEPYNISNMHEGDEGVYNVDSITDWIIYTKTSNITPDKVYLLD